MKKTLNINIGNSIIHIEEDAYELLKAYLNEIKAHFAKNADDFEIVTDIENRIAEMFREILFTQQKQAISIEDVALVKAQMGSVNDFESIEEEEVPYATATASSVKKLYRDTERGMVAGVCAGLGHYLNLEERWVRLFFLIFIFLGGASIWVYLIMWIIVPRAATRSEKMYMKGEAVNLQGFVRSFQEEMESNQLMKRSGSVLKEMFDLLGRFLASAGRIVFKLGAAFIIFIASCFLLSLIVMLAAFLGLFDANAAELFPFSMVNSTYLVPMLIAAFVCFAVPLLALVVFSLRVAFNTRPVTSSVSFSFLMIWLLGVATSIYYVAKVSSEFKEEAEVTKVAPLKAYPVYTLDLNQARIFSNADSVKYQLKGDASDSQVVMDDDHGPFRTPNHVRIRIEKSQDANITLTQNFSSNGRTFDNALKHARNIRYNFLQQDSVLTFSPKLYLDKPVKWRNQEVRATLKVPVGTKLRLSDDLDRYLDHYGSWDCENAEGVEQEYTEWIMTEEGLICIHELKTGEHH